MRNISLISIVFLASCTTNSDPWRPLFNGSDLSNWEVLNGTAEFRIEDGAIIGVSQLNTPNTFLATKEQFGDFILELDVWVDPSLNSGIQVRSNSLSDYKDGRVHGYQVEIDPSDRAYSGGIYDEGRRDWLYPLSLNYAGRSAFKVNEWNSYRIQAIGPSIIIWVNNICTARLNDDLTGSGFIALQVHGIGSEDQAGKEIKWKNIRIATDNLDALIMQPPSTVFELNLVPDTITEYEAQVGWQTYDTSHSLEQFELSVEYKLETGGKGSINYLQSDEGPAFQILDHQSNPDSSSWHGALKGKMESRNLSWEQMGKRYLKSAENWNHARIVVKENHVEHWLNQFKVVEYDRGAFNFPSSGQISFLGEGVQFRSAKIKLLK